MKKITIINFVFSLLGFTTISALYLFAAPQDTTESRAKTKSIVIQLTDATQKGDYSTVKKILAKCHYRYEETSWQNPNEPLKANKELVDENGNSMGSDWFWLSKAVENGHIKIVKLFLQKDPRTNRQNAVLILASQKSQAEIVKLLLKKGANINAKDINNKTALDYAKEKGDQKIVKLLHRWQKKNPKK